MLYKCLKVTIESKAKNRESLPFREYVIGLNQGKVERMGEKKGGGV